MNISLLKHAIRRRLGRSRAIQVVPRAENAYATHVPVLISIGRMREIKRAIEFGCGFYSTLTLLDQAAFPSLISLCSYENDENWARKVDEVAAHDSRFSLITVKGSMSSVVETIDFGEIDLVFLDDSTSVSERSATIARVARSCESPNLMVVHDYEIAAYREAASSLPNHFAFTALNPNTGVIWHNVSLSRRQMKKVNRIIKDNCARLAFDDRAEWINLFRSQNL